jgi:hypothetical protein
MSDNFVRPNSLARRDASKILLSPLPERAYRQIGTGKSRVRSRRYSTRMYEQW